MRIYGKYDFGKAITLNGKHHGVEPLPTLPSWLSTDEGRVVYAEDTGLVWVGNSIAWSELTPGGIGAHDHDNVYYTESELDGGQLDNRYYTETEIDTINYTKTELDAGQLDNKYYTESELDGGQLDNRYYTETEIDTTIANYLPLTGGTLSSDLIVEGNLTISGTTTTIASTDTEVTDSTFTIKTAASPVDGSASFEVQRATNNAKLMWDDSVDKWQLDPGTTVVSNILVASDIGVLVSDFSHLHDDRYYTETEIDTINYTKTELDAGQLDNRYYTETELDTTFTGYSITSHDHSGTYEPVFTKGTAFNKDFGAIAGAVSEGNHTHAAANITYDNSTSGLTATQVKSAIDEVQVNIDNLNLNAATFEALDSAGDIGTAVDQVAIGNHLHDDRYYTESEINTTLTGYSLTSHDHSGTYEPVFVKNTAFNKDFGATSGTTAEGNDARFTDARTPTLHDNAYHNVTYITSSDITYENLNTNGDVGTGAAMVASGDHVHSSIYYTKTELDTTFTGYSVTSHDHSGTYEPVITPLTAFNKDFGAIAGTVAEGNDARFTDARTPTSHDNTYHSEIFITSAGVTYENLSTNSDIGTGATQVAQGDHTHDDRYYTESELDGGQLDTMYYTETEIDTKFSQILVPSTTGVPVDSPATGTVRFDASTDILYIYNGTTWVSTTLS